MSPWPTVPARRRPTPRRFSPNRRRASWVTADGHTEYDGAGTIYRLHLEPPIIPYEGAPDRLCAFHYTGHAEPGRLDTRLREEASGGSHAAKIMQYQVSRGGTFRVVGTEPGGYADERRAKQASARRECPEPECVKAAAAQRERKNAAKREARAGWRAEAGWESAAAEALGAHAKAQADAATWSPELEAEAG